MDDLEYALQIASEAAAEESFRHLEAFRARMEPQRWRSKKRGSGAASAEPFRRS